MRYHATFLTVFAIGGLLGSAAIALAEEKTEKMKKMDTVKIIDQWKGHNSAAEKASEAVVKTQADWEKLWDQVASLRMPKPETPKVDFGKNMVIAVLMGSKRSGGYSVQITEVKEDGHLTATVMRKSPPRGAMVTMALTSPYHFVVVPRSDKPVRFVEADAKATDVK